MTLLAAALTGSLGAVCRYLLGGAVQGRTESTMPVGTAVVNLLGAFALGLVAGATDLDSIGRVAFAGFLGGFTTFSTWMVETVRLATAPRLLVRAFTNLTGVLVIGLALAVTGYHLTT